jgi:hypothetical protein
VSIVVPGEKRMAASTALLPPLFEGIIYFEDPAYFEDTVAGKTAAEETILGKRIEGFRFVELVIVVDGGNRPEEVDRLGGAEPEGDASLQQLL